MSFFKQNSNQIEYQLENGLTVILKDIPYLHSTSIGIFTKIGLMDEPLKYNGISHVLEHMAFKGTEKRTAKEIAEQVDLLGGFINAYTSKEYTCYYLTVLADHLIKGIELLADLFFNSKLTEEDLEMEKKVILEEINMYEDSPDENIHDLFASTIWQKTKLGLPVIGNKQSVSRINQKVLSQYYRNYCNLDRVILVIAGKISDLENVEQKIRNLFQIKGEKNDIFYDKPLVKPSVFLKEKNTEQIHFCLGCQGLKYDDPKHYTLTLLNIILGETMSSRLFQEIREKRGLCYSVYSYLSFYKNTGLFTIYSGVNEAQFMNTLDLILLELIKLKEKGVTQKEFIKAKEHLKGNIAISLEKSTNWLNFLARIKMYYHKLYTLEEILDLINQVTIDDVNNLAQKIFDFNQFALTGIGKFKKMKLADDFWQNLIKR